MFSSETDAETVSHLIERHYDGDLVAAVAKTFSELEGHFTFVVIHADHPELLVAARLGTPLVVGIGAGENFLASNAAAFLEQTRRVYFPDDGDIVADHARLDRLHARGRLVRHARARGARLGPRGRGEGRFRDLHVEGDPRAARGRRRDDRRPRPPRSALPRGPRHGRRRAGRAAPDRHPRQRHRVPRRCCRAVRDRGVGARPGRARHRVRVGLPQPRSRQGHAGDRDLAVGRDPRHDRGDEARALDGRAHGRPDEHDGLADHARGRLRPLHARGPRGERGGVEDVHRAAVAALPRRAEARPGAKDAQAGGPRVHRQGGLPAARADRPLPRGAAIRSRRSRSGTSTSRSSSTSAATSACRWRWKAR